MKFRILCSAFLCSALMVGTVFLAAPVFAGGDAGCGLGSMIFTKNSKVSQTLALTTNASTYTQLFGITSGTSGCSSSSIVERDRESVKYAETNLPSLKVEMARGEGESLTAFAELVGCETGSVAAFARMSRAHYGSIFGGGTDSGAGVVQAVRTEISRDPSLSRSCTQAI